MFTAESAAPRHRCFSLIICVNIRCAPDRARLRTTPLRILEADDFTIRCTNKKGKIKGDTHKPVHLLLGGRKGRGHRSAPPLTLADGVSDESG